MTVSTVIPTLNEEKNIREVLEQIRDMVDEVVIVDGGSSDKTVEYAREYDTTILFDDKGKGSALRKGLREAAGDIVVMMDADLSHGANEIPVMVQAVESGFDIAMGSRFIQGGGTEDMPLHRRLGNKFFVYLVNLLWNMNYSDLCYGYRALNQKAIQTLELTRDGFGIETEISIQAAKHDLKVIEIPSFEKKRKAGEAKLKTISDGYRIFKTIMEHLTCH